MSVKTSYSRFLSYSIIFFGAFVLDLANPKVNLGYAESIGNADFPPLLLHPGEQRVIEVAGLKRYSIGGSAIHVTRLGSALGHGHREELLIKAVAQGSGDLWVWKSVNGAEIPAEHRIVEVTAATPDVQNQPLTRALSQLQELEVYFAGEQISLRGEILTMGEAARVASLERAFTTHLNSEYSISESLLTPAEAKCSAWLKASGFSEQIKLEINETLEASGNLEKQADRLRVERKLREIFPLIRLSLLSLSDDSPVVHFRVFLLEVKKNRLRSLGLGWPESIPNGLHVEPRSISQSLAWDLQLNALEKDGTARVLSRPELVVRAPGEAELFAGGELPIHTSSPYHTETSWKNFGLTLKLKITQIAGKRVRLEVFTEVSHLDPSIGHEKIPGIQANRMQTQVDARFGSPLMLAGLLQDELRKQSQGLPWLSSIPVLGALFGSEDYQKDRSELVAILVPNLEPPQVYSSPELTDKLQFSPETQAPLLPPSQVATQKDSAHPSEESHPSERTKIERSATMRWGS